MKRLLARLAICTLVCVTATNAARALPPPEKDWEIKGTLYGWAASIQAKAEARGVETTIDEGFFDILSDLGWAAMGGTEARYKRALLVVDFIGMQIATSDDTNPRQFPFTLPDGRLGNLSVGGLDTSTRTTAWMVDTKLGFRALSLPITKLCGKPDDPEDRRKLDVDLLAGIRYWNVENKIRFGLAPASLSVGGAPVAFPGILPDLDLGDVRLPGRIVNGLINGTSHKVDDTVQWVDPIVGLRVTGGVTKDLSLFAMGDIGGWGSGGGGNTPSKLTWQGMLGANYNFSDHWGVAGGYRALGLNRGTALKNTILYGPQIGVVFRF